MGNTENKKDFTKIIATIAGFNETFFYDQQIRENLFWHTISKVWYGLAPDEIPMFVQEFISALTKIGNRQFLKDILNFLPFKSEGLESFRSALKDGLNVMVQDQSKKEKFLAACLKAIRQDQKIISSVGKMIEQYHINPEENNIFGLILKWNFHEVQTEQVRISILEMLLDQSKYHQLFWKLQNLLRNASELWWNSIICGAVTAKSRDTVNVLPETEQEGQKIIRLLTEKYCNDPDVISGRTATKMTIIFFCELTSATPRKQLLAAWKTLPIGEMKSDDLIRLSHRLDDDLPNRTEEGSVIVDLENIGDRFVLPSTEVF